MRSLLNIYLVTDMIQIYLLAYKLNRVCFIKFRGLNDPWTIHVSFICDLYIHIVSAFRAFYLMCSTYLRMCVCMCTRTRRLCELNFYQKIFTFQSPRPLRWLTGFARSQMFKSESVFKPFAVESINFIILSTRCLQVCVRARVCFDRLKYAFVFFFFFFQSNCILPFLKSSINGSNSWTERDFPFTDYFTFCIPFVNHAIKIFLIHSCVNKSNLNVVYYTYNERCLFEIKVVLNYKTSILYNRFSIATVFVQLNNYLQIWVTFQFRNFKFW